jgi:phage shock protein C
MFCTACGFEMAETNRYCAQCGKPVNEGQYRWNVSGGSAAAAPKPLERNMFDSKIAGVCSGFAQYFGMDVTVMRLLWVLLAIFTGITLIAYPVCWMVMPRNDLRPAPNPAMQTN